MRIAAAVFGVVLLAAGAFAGYGYTQYQQREAQIAEVLAFQNIAFRAYGALANGSPQAALGLYEEALAIHDQEPGTLREYANALQATGQPAQAMATREKAYALQGQVIPSLLEELAEGFHALGDHARSAKYHGELIEHFRPRYRYIRNLALALDAQGEFDEAMRYYAYVREREPDFFRDDADMQRFEQAYRPEIVAYDLTPAYDTTDDIPALLAIAAGYVARGFDNRALATYRKIVMIDEHHDTANLAAADILIRNGNTRDAIGHLDLVQARDFDTWFKLGGAHHQNKAWDKAAAAYEEAWALAQTDLLAKNLAAVSFFRGDVDSMQKYLLALRGLNRLLAHEFEYALLEQAGVEITLREKIVNEGMILIGKLRDLLTGTARG